MEEDGEVEDGELEDSSSNGSTILVSSEDEDTPPPVSEGTVQVKNYLSHLISGFVVIISFVSDHDPCS